MLKNGNTRALPKKIKDLMVYLYNGNPPNKGEVVIEYRTEAEGLRLAKKYKALADNPSIQLKITFKKLT
jgi:hypothetical protein